MPTSTLTDTVWRLAEPWLGAERVELDDVEMLGQGPGRTLRILVDNEDGLDLDRISALSEGLSRLLEDEPTLADPYRLEVSSPGLERRLRSLRHWEKSIGRQVKVKVRGPDGNRTLTGSIVSVADEVVIATDGGEDRIVLDDVVEAKTVFRWETTPKPGGKPGNP